MCEYKALPLALSRGMGPPRDLITQGVGSSADADHAMKEDVGALAMLGDTALSTMTTSLLDDAHTTL